MTQGFRPDVSLPSLYKVDLAHMEGCNHLGGRQSAKRINPSVTH
jgi:hypothetical protein